MYIAQQAFTTGEISPEVLARSELDKYQYALKQARNVYIRPYGAVYRRSGTVYHNACKYADKKAILVEFNFSVELSYMLEIGEGYIRVHKNGEYLNVELATPYTEADLPKLRFAQSADVMYITSGNYPVKTLSRYAEDDWRFADFDVSQMYYDPSMGVDKNKNYDGAEYTTAGSYTFTPKITGKYTVEVAGAGGGAVNTLPTMNWVYNGGNGELVRQILSINAGATITVNVGAGGQSFREGQIPPMDDENRAPSGESSQVICGETTIKASGGTYCLYRKHYANTFGNDRRDNVNRKYKHF